MIERDYDLLGESGKRAVEIGLAAAEWYHSDIPRDEMKELMTRRDGPAIRDSIIYYGAMILLAGLTIWLWPSPWAFVPFMGYAVLYGSASDSRWHEAGHRTAFKTRWMNRVVYHIACFMLFRNPVIWRWSHSRHHTDTIIVGRDPEIQTMRPPKIPRIFLLLIGKHQLDGFLSMFRYAFQGLNEAEKSFVPEPEQPKVAVIARVWVAICAAVVLTAMATQSVLPLLLVGIGPSVFGSWHFIMTGLLQHTGMADNVIDHRLNTRTVYMNPISRFIYWNMNYHVEHHMFPMVPYHALPRLHEKIKHDLPEPNHSIAEGLAEVIGALRRQLKDREYRVEKRLPPTARPYRMDYHAEALGLPAE